MKERLIQIGRWLVVVLLAGFVFLAAVSAFPVAGLDQWAGPALGAERSAATHLLDDMIRDSKKHLQRNWKERHKQEE